MERVGIWSQSPEQKWWDLGIGFPLLMAIAAQSLVYSFVWWMPLISFPWEHREAATM